MPAQKNGLRKTWAEMSVKVKVITGTIAILIAFLGVHPYLPASLSLTSAVASETTDREQGDLETQLDIVNLEIQFYLKQKDRDGTLSLYDQDDLDLAIKRRDRLIQRLSSILA